MKKILITFLITLLVLAMAYPHNMPNPKLKKGGYNGSSIKLPNGFSVKIIATDLGATRHIAVAKNGDIYAKLSKLKDGKGIYLLRDTNKDGIINETKLFGDYPGTGVFINDDDLYTSSNSGVYRYKMNAKGEVIDYQKPEVIVSGLVDRKRDNAKPLVVDKQNIIYVTIGSYNNPSREMGSGKGINPCSILDSAGFFVNFGEKYLIKQF